MAMEPPSELVTRAAILRLDVYDGVGCDGARVQTGAPPPSESKAAQPGTPIDLDIPPGRHALELTAFADEGQTQPIGSACSEATLTAGTPACFHLALAPLPDAAAPPPCDGGPCPSGCMGAADCAANPVEKQCDLTTHRCVECLGPGDCAAGKRCSPSGACADGCDPGAGSMCAGALACCSMACTDLQRDVASCGACGRTCDSTHVAQPTCAGGLCTPSCAPGWGDCNQPIAPTADDGCETNLNDVQHCGACNKTCTFANATPACPSGSCVLKSCNGGFFDCDGQTQTGCECPGVDKQDGLKGCCPGGACQAQHSDGFGHSFYDCVAFGTYSMQVAADAARAYDPAASQFMLTCPDGVTQFIGIRPTANPNSSVTWAYSSSVSTLVGHAHYNALSNGFLCPTVGDVTWK